MSTSRVEAFSDGVFAIAITLLVLDLKIGSGSGAGDRLAAGWPSYVAYLISFCTIGGAWLGHHALADRLERTDPVFLRLNLLVLLTVSVLPFPTALMAKSLGDVGDERVYVTFYGVVLLAVRLTGWLAWRYACRAGLTEGTVLTSTTQAPADVEPGSSASEADASDRPGLVTVLISYVFAIALGLIVPYAAVALYGVVAVALVVPLRELKGVFVWKTRQGSR